MTAIPPAGRDAPTCDVCLNPLPDDEAILDFGRHPECDRFVVRRGEDEIAAVVSPDAPEPRPKPLRCPRCGSTLIEGAYATWWCPTEACRDDAAAPRPAGPTPEIDALLDAFQQACEDCIEIPYPEKYEALPKRDAARESLRTALASARAALSEATRREEALLRFAGRALNEARIEQIGDWDGGDLEEAMVECGLLAPHEATEPCDPESCRCAEFGFPTTCYRFTELGKLAARAAIPEEARHGE